MNDINKDLIKDFKRMCLSGEVKPVYSSKWYLFLKNVSFFERERLVKPSLSIDGEQLCIRWNSPRGFIKLLLSDLNINLTGSIIGMDISENEALPYLYQDINISVMNSLNSLLDIYFDEANSINFIKDA